MNKLPVILDTDPGLDDAIAVGVLAAFCKERIAAIISSYGNVNVDTTTKNVLNLVNLYNIKTDVIKGCEHPLSTKKYEDAPHIHGQDGLGGTTLKQSDQAAITTDPVKSLYEVIIKHNHVDYITLGPLTNLATLIDRYPDVVSHISRVVSMGGAFGMGNVTEHAEFNIYCDAAAASRCFNSDLHFTLVPLNTTHQVALSLEEIEGICVADNEVATIMKQILTANYHSNVAAGDEGSIVHDATAVMYYLFPEIFTTSMKMHVTVRLGGKRIGETIEGSNLHNIYVTTGINRLSAIDKLREMVSMAGR